MTRVGHFTIVNLLLLAIGVAAKILTIITLQILQEILIITLYFTELVKGTPELTLVGGGVLKYYPFFVFFDCDSSNLTDVFFLYNPCIVSGYQRKDL